MQIGDFSLDHFLPWRFVAHDQLWNIIPTPRSVNSSKRDNLPDFGQYFEPFAAQQYRAIRLLADSAHARLLEDYSSLLKTASMSELHEMSYEQFREHLQATLAPQFQIAANMGFSGRWSYTQ